MNINIETNTTQQLTTAEVDLLAKHLCGVRLTLADSGVPTYNIQSVTQRLGGLNASCSAVYKDAVDALALKGINVSYTTLYIRILDPEVFSVLDSLNIGNGTGITPALAAAATFGNAFQLNADIVNFDAYKYFTKQNGATDANASTPSFDLCTSLESIDITGATKMPRFSKCYNLEYFHGSDSEAGTVIFGNITSIGGYTFLDCAKLRRLILTNSLGTGSNSFLFLTYTNGITRIDVDTVEHLLNCSWAVNGHPFGNNTEVYINNSKLTHLEVPNTISTIKSNALRNYKGLTALTLHGDMTIGGDAFTSCSNLNAVYIDSLSDWLSITFNNQPLQFAHNLYINGSLVDSVTIPSGIDLKYKFFGSTSLTSVVIESGKTSIENSAFRECNSLTSINIPSGVTDIGLFAFQSCTNLEISDLNLPNLTSLGNNAFTSTKVQTISDLGSITSVPQYCFKGCTALTSVTLPNGVTSIGHNAFEGCTVLTSINIPEGVTSIGNNVFQNCRSLTSVIIPSSVTSIGTHAFNLCSGLTAIIINATTPPTLANSFINTNCPIYVPAGSVSAYQSASTWSAYVSRIQAIPTT